MQPASAPMANAHHTLSVLVENKAGVLTRIASLFARRGFNIYSLAVAPTEDDRFSRITIVVDVESAPLEQIVKQLDKLINVVSITELAPQVSLERELLVAGQESMCELLSEGIAEAPEGASPMAAVAAALERASTMMGPDNRELGPRIKAAVASSTELQERDALKTVSLAAAMTAALLARGVPETTAHLAGELGVLAFKQGYARWSEGPQDDGRGLADYAVAALDDLRAASRALD